MKNLGELDILYRKFEKGAEKMTGYPLCQFFDYSKLYRFLRFHINNLGDPFGEPWHYQMNTLKIERQVIEQFAELFNAPKDSYWGYVTGGGTEGNLYGLYVARELYPEGVVFYSDQTHYSIPKNLRLLRMPGVQIKSTSNGEIDYLLLQEQLVNLNKVPIIFANIGTTMKGAVDDIVRIKEILSDLNIHKYYIHCDAAFFGMILPFVPELESQPFDFRMGIDSIVISGHKMIGTPIPCGVVLTKKSHVTLVGNHIEYVRTQDKTITGSRSGWAPLLLWYELNSAKKGKFENLVHQCIKSAGYAIKKFSRYGIEAWRNKNSIIVIFPRPSLKTIKKWQLAVQGDIAHVITLPHVSKNVIDQLVKDVALDLKQTSGKRKKLTTRLP